MTKRIGLAVESMSRHMTDEGMQIFLGLQHAGYSLWGHNFPNNDTDVRRILAATNPDIIVIQDKREWDTRAGDFRDPLARFNDHGDLRRHRAMKVTILKDAHQRPEYHKQAAKEMGVHLHIIYYYEPYVRKLAPYLDKVVRTYHTIDKEVVPKYDTRDGYALLSGAVSNAYPLRERLFRRPPANVVCLKHPGYHRQGSATPKYLETLSQFRIAICTCSIYKYALRKIIEATACGCRVITDLPQEDCLPGIDENLVRIDSNATTKEIQDLVAKLYNSYKWQDQLHFSNIAKEWYDYRAMGQRLSDAIDEEYISYLNR